MSIHTGASNIRPKKGETCLQKGEKVPTEGRKGDTRTGIQIPEGKRNDGPEGEIILPQATKWPQNRE